MRIRLALPLSLLLSLSLSATAAAPGATPQAKPAPASAAKAKPEASLPLSELSLGGLKLGDSAKRVQRRHGKPQVRSQPGEMDYAYLYPGLEVSLAEDGRVVGLDATSPKHCTPSGLCPGQPLAKALERWGDGVGLDDRDGVEYYVPGETCWLRLDLSGQTITALRVLCAI